jgi:hypothetical protein
MHYLTDAMQQAEGTTHHREADMPAPSCTNEARLEEQHRSIITKPGQQHRGTQHMRLCMRLDGAGTCTDAMQQAEGNDASLEKRYAPPNCNEAAEEQHRNVNTESWHR